jgi:hypothetical protein
MNNLAKWPNGKSGWPKTAEFKILPKGLIDNFAGFAKCALEKREQNIISVQILARLSHAHLPKLMSGEIQVKELSHT